MAAALLTAGALLTTACSSEDDQAIENTTPSVGSETIQFTATLAPKGDDGTTTRAITVNNQGTANETLTTRWAVGEEISVIYYQQHPESGPGRAQTTATVNAVEQITGTATISAALTSPMDGGTVTFVYPAMLRTDLYDVPEAILLNQHGNLTKRTTPNASVDDISSNFDYATGSGNLSVAAGAAVVSSNVTMTNEVCICKFRFTLDNGSGSPIQQAFDNIKIYDNNEHVYTITSDRPDTSPGSTGGTRCFTDTDDIYVALLPISGKTVTFSYTQSQGSGNVTYSCTKTNVTLEKGKFYRNLGTITLVRQN